MIELNEKNKIKVLNYLHSTEAFKIFPKRDVAKHLDQLIRWDQMDAVEDADGQLIYAWAWYKLSDKALEDYMKLIPPKRANRGRNMVALFGMNGSLSVSSMLRVIRRVIRSEKPNKFVIYTTRKKWVVVEPKKRVPNHQRKKTRMAKDFWEIIQGGEIGCLQQSRSAL